MVPVTKANGEHHDTMAAQASQRNEQWLPGLSSIPDVESDMPPKLTDDQRVQTLLAAALERMIVRLDTPPTSNGNGKKWWLGPVVAGGIAVTGVFGIQYIPKAQSDTQRQMDSLTSQVDQFREMKARYENLRTLYIIRFGEDPDTVTPETMRHGPLPKTSKK